MEFLSIPFSFTIILSFILYYIKENKNWQRFVLLATSFVFIGFYHWQYLVYAIGITLFTYYTAHWLYKNVNTKKANYILTFGISSLVGIWLLARYYSHMFPLGISFYTFQAISYLIETSWEEEPEDDVWDFSVYMLLFMKFLSGPIERSYDFLPQLKKVRSLNYELITNGMLTVAWGAFLKLMIADRMSIALDVVFNDVFSASNWQLVIATICYPIQLYADFAGYTLMALGIGKMFGFKLSPNFDRPFISLTTSELWRRWHQSLSFWVRDYVFSPLSVSLRKYKEWGVYFSLLVTFVTIGVWHGAGWAFVYYGLFQAIVIMWEHFSEKKRNAIQEKLPSWLFKPFMITRTYVLFALSLLFFRVPDATKVWHIYSHLLPTTHISLGDLTALTELKYWTMLLFFTLIMFIFEYYNSKTDLLKAVRKLPFYLRWAIYFAIILIIFRFGAFGVENFIYVQF